MDQVDLQRKSPLEQVKKMPVNFLSWNYEITPSHYGVFRIRAKNSITILFIVAPPSLSAKAKLDMAQLRQMGGTSQYKFSVLSKIVRHMRHRHMEGEDQALTLDDILDETNQVKK